jgi:NADH-quinone oxidoreductase subunit L
MTTPLVILGALAIFASFLNAAALHIEPLGHLLEPIFEKAHHAIAWRTPDVEKMELAMMAPGVLAFLVGGGLAYFIYYKDGGAQERQFAESFPRLYKLIYDKWRIDELYDVVVVGMLDALADIFVMADKWIIDGVLARLSAAIVGAAGTVLRALQTGRVQAYSASMVVGLVGIGWFLVRPHPSVSIDDKAFRSSGQVTISASPGLGYRYRWQVPGTPQQEFSEKSREITVTLQPGESKEVVLEVQNAFNSVARETIPLSRLNPNVMGKRSTVVEIGGAK